MSELKYLLRVAMIYIMRFLLHVFYIFPIKKNRIVFTSQLGKQYSCNPKYISEYLENQYPGKFEIIWMLDEPEKYLFLNERGIKTVNNHSLKKFYYELTAKVSVINNGNRYARIPKRKRQIHINTWHGGGYYKLCGLNEIKKDKFEIFNVILSSKNTTYFLSTNQCFTDNEIRHDFDYKGEVLNIGSPRNDILFNFDYVEIHRKVCNYFGIKNEYNIILYAPTYRYGKDAAKFQMPNFTVLKKVASKYFGGEWVVLTRMHFMTEAGDNSRDTLDANYRPEAPEMQELLAASSMLISDYSSCIWDYSFTYRPCFLFTPDLDEYTADRGFGIDIYEWGFPVCKTEQELWDAIENYDPIEFRKAMERHHEDLGSFEHGNATEIMGKLIYDFCFPEKTSES